MEFFVKLRCRRGDSNLISMMIILPVILAFLCGGILIFIQTSKLDNIRQIAQLMAREVALTGRVDDNAMNRLEDLEQLYKMEVEMEVDGDYLGSSKKLRLESNFEVTITYHDKYGMGGLLSWGKEATYVRKASGIVEEYHKTL